MRYVTFGIAIAAASAVMLSLAPLKAQEVIGDSNGPVRQHGLCMFRGGDLEGQLGYLAPCPDTKKAAATTRSKRR